MATTGGTSSLSLNASFDRRKDLAVDNYKAQLTGLAVYEMSFDCSDFLPSKVTNANADASIVVTMPGNHFDSNAKMEIKNLPCLLIAIRTDWWNAVCTMCLPR
jgi:hypothetical protein